MVLQMVALTAVKLADSMAASMVVPWGAWKVGLLAGTRVAQTGNWLVASRAAKKDSSRAGRLGYLSAASKVDCLGCLMAASMAYLWVAPRAATRED